SDLVLIPGDSPIGLRLPLSKLGDDALRQGLTVELKENSLLVFLPPLATFAVFSELVTTIEKLITTLDLPPIHLEGYPPPGDDDMESIALTSDPGVIEVNLPPASEWSQFEQYIDGMYECAHNVGLRSFKYQLSGREVGSGGGTHIVIGGPDIERNPFVAKPSLLSSFLRFLQHHPSLSFAFSGLFIGPSSQAPRVDESAYELPYELEITLRAIEEMAEPGSPEEIDALLRNLLMDWNGNTHRAELSVDKFYNFNAPNGQNGLVEFRAFEMMPKATMLLAANALIRALAACFAEKPYTLPLHDWREALHDKYALPYFLNEDLCAVIDYMNGHGFTFEKDAFADQIDFRFPEITSFDTSGCHWTLRQALEPWPVMGEHEGTGRVVDSTTDRLELRVAGDDLDSDVSAYTVGINGIEMPMVGATHRVRVGAVRYRLFDNPWGLQPQIKAHTPLEIRIIESASGKIVHALDYTNWTLEKAGYDRPPETKKEARRRVEERLSLRSDLIGEKQDLVSLDLSPDAPYTLDLRRV
ncbi:MAG: transglutaminase family protein, partial [Gammaproteobacteria bacterium]